jgi:hypothetical protein
MALFGNLGVNLRGCLCGVLRYASAQLLVSLDLADPDGSGLNWKLTLVLIRLNGICGWARVKKLTTYPIFLFSIIRARVKIGLRTLAYNIFRYKTLVAGARFAPRRITVP